ncbi:MAG: hypothetical protein A2Z12_07550 [Actinobacteria bacterium RBG_16_68_21]|nr:MAG: hypothetical protein A2Z12_07550 [Actinobacteria bacterium RBG_16_68_21]
MRRVVPLIVFGLVVTGCAGSTPVSLDISSQIGYAVVVEETASSLSIGFAADRDAAAGTPYDVTQAVWRVDDGPWSEPPVTCLGKGQRVELGIAQVENVARPGLLIERVVWLVCLPPE